jgi:5'-nucleotidase (lipoprotein e(P4) family)
MRGLALLGALALAACAMVPPQPAPQTAAAADRCSPAPAFAAGGERATLWLRHSAEFRAASEIIYRAAETALRAGLADPARTAEPAQTGDLSALPPAIVMDIDETVLDNSAPQARMILEETCFEEFEAVWDAWLAERAATAVPGAAAFIRAARTMNDSQGRHVRIFFVTNRECDTRAGDDSACPQQDDTAANLERLGLGAPTLAEDLMVKGERADWLSEKLSRRLEIAKSHRIVLNVGDDLGDFLPDVRRQTAAERERARCAHRERWGRQWFMIPNPMYGSWLVTLGPDPAAALAADPPVAANCDTP